VNFQEYGGKALYKELAQLVKSVIEGAVAAREDLPRLQAVQARPEVGDALAIKKSPAILIAMARGLV